MLVVVIGYVLCEHGRRCRGRRVEVLSIVMVIVSPMISYPFAKMLWVAIEFDSLRGTKTMTKEGRDRQADSVRRRLFKSQARLARVAREESRRTRTASGCTSQKRHRRRHRARTTKRSRRRSALAGSTASCRTHDEKTFVRKFTPRRARSIWSKVNRAKAERLIESGRMKPPGLKAIERAREGGEWDGAYDSARTADDLAGFSGGARQIEAGGRIFCEARQRQPLRDALENPDRAQRRSCARSVSRKLSRC